jgi:hypothetical protein
MIIDDCGERVNALGRSNPLNPLFVCPFVDNFLDTPGPARYSWISLHS